MPAWISNADKHPKSKTWAELKNKDIRKDPKFSKLAKGMEKVNDDIGKNWSEWK